MFVSGSTKTHHQKFHFHHLTSLIRKLYTMISVQLLIQFSLMFLSPKNITFLVIFGMPRLKRNTVNRDYFPRWLKFPPILGRTYSAYLISSCYRLQILKNNFIMNIHFLLVDGEWLNNRNTIMQHLITDC